MVEASLASAIMYYEGRFVANEMGVVTARMRDSFSAMSVPGDDPHTLLIEWGKAILAKFKVDNLHLTDTKDKNAGNDGTTTMGGMPRHQTPAKGQASTPPGSPLSQPG